MRTGLTLLGLIIGIASIMIVFSAGEGIKSLVVGQIESFGTDIIVTEIRVPSNKTGNAKETESGVAMMQGVQVTTLTLDDMSDIDKLPNIIQSYGGLMTQEVVSYKNETHKAILLATNSNYIDIDKSEIAEGRFFTDAEDKALAKEVVLGSGIKEKLFGESEALGKLIKVGKSKYRVIGIMKKRGAVMTMNYDDYIYVPIQTAQKRLMGINHVTYLVHQVDNLDLSYETADEIRAIVRENHDITDPSKDDFRVTTMEEMLDMLGIITNVITLLLLAIVVISLVVGGVGVMNIMYVIISERTHEIGLRKAVGANFQDIMFYFLIESLLITTLSGLIGILIGIGGAYLMALGAIQAGLDWKFSIPFNAFIVAILFSIIAGVLFGMYPAQKAAHLDPIEALRK